MSDQTEAHRHEWHISESGSPYHDVDAGCRHCNARLTEEEVNARLNGLTSPPINTQKRWRDWAKFLRRLANELEPK